MQRLVTLNLSKTGVTASGLEAILGLPRPQRLAHLMYEGDDPDEKDPELLRRLQQHFGPGVCDLF
jgi:hypothetical protein